MLYLASMKESFLKSQFIKDVLLEQGNRLMKNQGAVLYKRLKYDSGELKSQRSVSVSYAGEKMSGKLSFKHTAKERFLDMKRNVKRKRKAGTRNKRGYKIHNHFVFGHYQSIATDLMYGFTEDVAESIRNRFKRNSNG